MIYIINGHFDKQQNALEPDDANRAVTRKQTTQQDDDQGQKTPSRLMAKLRRRHLELAMLGRFRASDREGG